MDSAVSRPVRRHAGPVDCLCEPCSFSQHSGLSSASSRFAVGSRTSTDGKALWQSGVISGNRSRFQSTPGHENRTGRGRLGKTHPLQDSHGRGSGRRTRKSAAPAAGLFADLAVRQRFLQFGDASVGELSFFEIEDPQIGHPLEIRQPCEDSVRLT